jgi:catechol 2,3-dioxygenase-like lactoylglutathione lyase family enzyme
MPHPPIDQQITFLYTRSLATTAPFYEDILGLTLVLDQSGCRIYRVSPDGYVGVCERENAQPPVGVVFTLVTSQVDEWYEYLTARGVTFEKMPAINTRDNIYHCFLRDPNGYLIEIQRFLDPNWNR